MKDSGDRNKIIALLCILVAAAFFAFGLKFLYQERSKKAISVVTSPPDNSQVTVPPESSKSSGTNAVTVTSREEETEPQPEIKFPMDINDAYTEALLCVPGIGEVLAGNIMDFIAEKGVITHMDMLLEVEGIGDSKLNSLKEYFYVSDKYTVTTKKAVKVTTSKKQTTTKVTTTKITTTKPPKTTVTTTTTTTAPPMRSMVNINLADKEELKRCLLITDEQAEDIVSLRNDIGAYSNILEVLYCESISDNQYLEIRDYMTVE